MLRAKLAFGILAPSLVAGSISPLAACDASENFLHFNSSKIVPLPALWNNGPMLNDDPDETWYLSLRSVHSQTSVWMNTGNSDMTDIGSCWYTTWTYGTRGFAFSRDVLERSVDDKGDCKTMLGEECVAALKRQYQSAALWTARSASCDDDGFPYTVPQECAGLVAGGNRWRGGVVNTEIDLQNPFNRTMLKEGGCPNNSMAFNNSMHWGSNTGGSYNYTVRFPQLYFFTFWPNRTHDPASAGLESDYVRAEVLCLRTDDIEEGSQVPPSAQELLDAEDVKYDGNASNASNSSSGSGGGVDKSDSEGSAAVMKVVAPYLSAAAIAGLLLR